MKASEGARVRPVRAGAIAIVVFGGIAAAVLLTAPGGGEGPSSRCETAGGHYLVGPGGESACLDRHTFLPILEYEHR